MKFVRSMAVLLAVAVSPAHADWLTGRSLTQVGSGDYAGEYVWFSTSQAIANPANCGNTDIYVLRTLPKNALAILLAAKVSNSQIRLFVHGTTCDASTGRPLVVEVAIQ